MDKQSRRQVVRDYKERKITAGIFAVRCTATDQAWVGAASNIEQQQNGIWFALRHGSGRNPGLQAAWKSHGEAAFAFDVLEAIETADLSAYAIANRLKERDAHWRAKLAAPKLAG